MKRTIFLIVLSTLLLFGVAYLAGDTHALDAPHDISHPVDKVNCENCHYPFGTTPAWLSQPVLEDNTALNNLCTSCHNPASMSGPPANVQTHSSYKTTNTYGTWVTECRTCHNPHYQRQVSAYRTEGLLDTGNSTGLTTTVLTDTNKAWADGAFIDFVLVPNTAYPTVMYRITANTATTITVQGTMLLAPYAEPGNPYAVRYSRMVKDSIATPASGLKAVKFFNKSGADSFADAIQTGPTTFGVCQACHTRTVNPNNAAPRHRNAGSTDNHNVLVNCMTCHSHDQGFKAPVGAQTCVDCHGATPSVFWSVDLNGNANAPGAHAKHFEDNVWYTTSYDDTNLSTTTVYKYNCQKCHETGHDAAPNPNIIFTSTNNPPSQGGSYTLASQTCTTVYCHSDGLGTYPVTAAAWNTPSTGACGTCHGNEPATPPASGSHVAHVGTTAGLQLTCLKCHADTATTAASLNSVKDKLLHVNNVADWNLDSTDARFTGSSYSGVAAGTAGTKTPPSTTYGNCSNLYCHSDVQADGGTAGPTVFDTATWGDPATATCATSCHKDPIATGGHTVHLAVTGVDCSTCHSGSGTGTTAHANNLIDIAMSWGTYAQGNHAPGSGGYDSCSTTDCHGTITGTTTTPEPWATDLSTFQTCTKCHGVKTAPGAYTLDKAAPGSGGTGVDTAGDTATTDQQVGVHQAHLEAPRAYSNPIACNECHTVPSVFDSIGHIYDGLNDTTHVEAEVPLAGTLATTNPRSVAGTPTYTPSTCSNVYCHDYSRFNQGYPDDGVAPDPVTVPTWNATILDGTSNDCHRCHGYPPGTGHPNPVSDCNSCHDHVATGANPTSFLVVATHVNGLVEFAGGTCIGCHSSRQGTGATERVAVVNGTLGSEGDDFLRASRHVSDGTTTNEIVTDLDCIICHAEGDVTSTDTDVKTVSAAHGGDGGTKTVDLRNVDSAGATGILSAWPGTRLAGAASATTTHRNNMDWFCVGCHDADGSSTIALSNDNTTLLLDGATAVTRTGTAVNTNLRPFNTSDTMANNWDTADVNTYRNTTYGRVLNVKDLFNSQNLTGSQFASHHNLNIFTKRYSTRNTTAWPDAAFTTVALHETANLRTTGETTGLHCSDCHLNESNAHGSSNTPWMLQTRDGADANWVGDPDNTGTFICFKCHAQNVYSKDATAPENSRMMHSGGDANNFSRLGSAGKNSLMSCNICHGGYSQVSGGLGASHGNNETWTLLSPPGGTSKRYRFLNGASARHFYPTQDAEQTTASTTTDWDSQPAAGDYGCYTVDATDIWVDCNKHGNYSKANSANSKGNTINRARPLDY